MSSSRAPLVLSSAALALAIVAVAIALIALLLNDDTTTTVYRHQGAGCTTIGGVPVGGDCAERGGKNR